MNIEEEDFDQNDRQLDYEPDNGFIEGNQGQLVTANNNNGPNRYWQRNRKKRHNVTYYNNEIYVEHLDKEMETAERYAYYLQKDNKPHVYKTRFNKPLKVLMVAQNKTIAYNVTNALKEYFETGYDRLDYRNFTSGFGNVDFFDREANIIITGLNGNLTNRTFPQKYEFHCQIDPIHFFQIESKKYGVDPRNIDVETLEELAEETDIVVFWTETDNRGDNLCFEVLDVIYGLMNRRKFKQIYKAEFNSLHYNDITYAFEEIRRGPNIHRALAHEAANIFKLKVGVAFSKLMTSTIKLQLTGFERSTISIGPCQTPALGIVYKRHKYIESHKPNNKYKITATVLIEESNLTFDVELETPKKLQFGTRSKEFHSQSATIRDY